MLWGNSANPCTSMLLTLPHVTCELAELHSVTVRDTFLVLGFCYGPGQQTVDFAASFSCWEVSRLEVAEHVVDRLRCLFDHVPDVPVSYWSSRWQPVWQAKGDLGKLKTNMAAVVWMSCRGWMNVRTGVCTTSWLISAKCDVIAR